MRIIFLNSDTNGVMEWTFESELMSYLFVPSIFITLGEVPEHEYSETGDFMIIQLDISQINRMRERLEPWVGQNPGVEKFYNDMTFLLTCDGPIIIE